eukprot:Transcript_7264.p4 GENE.Transcript_7264~~Transcript_7264.p4  ORF type:complete len:134 (+),score=0.15 Transcript_7264:760-1161(+)
MEAAASSARDAISQTMEAAHLVEVRRPVVGSLIARASDRGREIRELGAASQSIQRPRPRHREAGGQLPRGRTDMAAQQSTGRDCQPIDVQARRHPASAWIEESGSRTRCTTGENKTPRRRVGSSRFFSSGKLP